MASLPFLSCRPCQPALSCRQPRCLTAATSPPVLFAHRGAFRGTRLQRQATRGSTTSQAHTEAAQRGEAQDISGKHKPASPKLADFGFVAALLLHWFKVNKEATSVFWSCLKFMNLPWELATASAFFSATLLGLGLAASCVALMHRRDPDNNSSLRRLFAWPGGFEVSGLLMVGWYACILSAKLVGLLPVGPQQADIEKAVFIKRSVAAGWASRSLTVVATVLVGPAAEEIFHRGFLLPRLASHMPRWAAMAVSAVLFTLAHNSLYPTRTIHNLVYDVLFFSSGSLWPSFLLHALWNAYCFR